MIESYIIGITGMIFLVFLWLVVQRQWRKIFYDQINDEDVLADRNSCGNCGCASYCENKKASSK